MTDKNYNPPPDNIERQTPPPLPPDHFISIRRANALKDTDYEKEYIQLHGATTYVSKFHLSQKVKKDSVEMQIIAVCHYVGNVQYQCSWFSNGDHKTSWFHEFELEVSNHE